MGGAGPAQTPAAENQQEGQLPGQGGGQQERCPGRQGSNSEERTKGESYLDKVAASKSAALAAKSVIATKGRKVNAPPYQPCSKNCSI